MGIALTVYFEDPFWVGLFERTGADRAVARVVFAAEPSAAEVYALVLRDFARLEFVPVGRASDRTAPRPVSPKRRQREASRATGDERPRTRAQEALRAALEVRKVAREEVSRAERRAAAERRYALRRARRKERHRGR